MQAHRSNPTLHPSLTESLHSSLTHHIVRRSNEGGEALTLFEEVREAEIAGLQVSCVCVVSEQEVFGLDVSVHYPKEVQMRHLQARCQRGAVANLASLAGAWQDRRGDINRA